MQRFFEQMIQERKNYLVEATKKNTIHENDGQNPDKNSFLEFMLSEGFDDEEIADEVHTFMFAVSGITSLLIVVLKSCIHL